MINLTKQDAIEISYKLGILCDSPELQADYNLTQDQADALLASVPEVGQWAVPDWGREAASGEIADHVDVLRSNGTDAREGGQMGQSLAIFKQAKRLERIATLIEGLKQIQSGNAASLGQSNAPKPPKPAPR